LVSYAQVDPKTEYKRVGMKEFDTMWEGLSDKTTDIVFRMEDDEAFAETVWTIGEMVHAAAPRLEMAEGSIGAQQQAAIAGSQTDKKQEPIRHEGKNHRQRSPPSWPQRPLPLRQRQEVQELPHARRREVK
jgi:preprotein translocase subunit SecA